MNTPTPTPTPNPTSNETGLSERWTGLSQGAKAGIVIGGALLSLLVVAELLPFLAASAGVGALIAILFVPYWLPTIIAFIRNHPSKFAIGAVNFFFGWTFVGWVVSLVWALSNKHSGGDQQVVVQTVVQNTNTTPGASPAPQYQIGDVVNGHRFDGAGWQPIAAAPQREIPAPPAPSPLPPAPSRHEVGDVVNGHRFTGTEWEPVSTDPGQASSS